MRADKSQASTSTSNTDNQNRSRSQTTATSRSVDTESPSASRVHSAPSSQEEFPNNFEVLASEETIDTTVAIIESCRESLLEEIELCKNIMKEVEEFGHHLPNEEALRDFPMRGRNAEHCLQTLKSFKKDLNNMIRLLRTLPEGLTEDECDMYVKLIEDYLLESKILMTSIHRGSLRAEETAHS